MTTISTFNGPASRSMTVAEWISEWLAEIARNPARKAAFIGTVRTMIDHHQKGWEPLESEEIETLREIVK